MYGCVRRARLGNIRGGVTCGVSTVSIISVVWNNYREVVIKLLVVWCRDDGHCSHLNIQCLVGLQEIITLCKYMEHQSVTFVRFYLSHSATFVVATLGVDCRDNLRRI